MSARDMVLGKLAERLNVGSTQQARLEKVRSRIAEHAVNTIPARGKVAANERVLLFEKMLATVHGTVSRVSGFDDVPAAVSDYLQANGLGSVLHLAPDVASLGINWSSTPGLMLNKWQTRQSVAVGITGCYAAVAETGSLLVCSSATHPITMNFLSEANIVLLNSSDLAGVYEEVWARIRKEKSGQMPRDMTLISSPSCTGDIEMILEYGVHGPKYLHVIIIE